MVLPSFERVFNKKTIFGNKLKHVIEPRATYRYVTGIGTDYDKFIRFDENDILSNTNELEIGLTNRIYAKRGNSIDEIFTWELYQKRYFDPTFGGALVPGVRNVFASTADLTAYAFLVGPRSSSPIVSMFRASPIPGLGIQWQADYDHRFGGVTDSSLSVDYRYKKYSISVGNNEVNTDQRITPPSNQFRGRIAFGDPAHKGINAGFELGYDYKQGYVQYVTSQLTYNTDCCGISVQFRQYNIPGVITNPEFRVAFSVANISTTLGNLKKQDRMF